jgi:hypothetical protein
MKKLLKEHLNEEFEEENENQGPFTDDDGWDQESLTDVGLIDWFDVVERIDYEIKNGRRGVYGIRGDTAVDLLNELRELRDALDNVIDSIEQQIE